MPVQPLSMGKVAIIVLVLSDIYPLRRLELLDQLHDTQRRKAHPCPNRKLYSKEKLKDQLQLR